jgi:hypothetical protein
MIKRIHSFFATLLSRESLSSKGADSVRKHGSFFSGLLQAEKLPEHPSRRSGKGFLSTLLAFEKLPSAKIQQPSGRNFISNLPTPEKNHPGTYHNE